MTWRPGKLSDAETDNAIQHMATQIQERQAAHQTGTTTSRPANPQTGWMYFDTTLGKPIWYFTSKGWVDATGAVV